MCEGTGFVVFQRERLTEFENKTDLNLLISIKPIKPKRKYDDLLVVPPRSFKIIEDRLDLTKLSFTLEKTCDT